MKLHQSTEIETFWKTACETLQISKDTPYIASPFCEYDDNSSEELLEVIDGIGAMTVNHLKRGTCHQAMQFNIENIPMRSVGDYWLVVDTKGSPVCIIKIIGINIVPFNQVGPEFAASEGPEGGVLPSHENWSFAHRDYFTEQCKAWGVEWREDNPVVCESFITVYSPEYPLGVRY